MVPEHLLILKLSKITLYAKSSFLVTHNLAKEGLLLPGAQLILGYVRNNICSGRQVDDKQNVGLTLGQKLYPHPCI